MGIRFFCPNGHKLNVKTELAGKRAICPDCGARLVVPVAGAASESSIQNLPASGHPAFQPTSPQAVAITPSAAVVEQAVVWYVRPAGGGQFGPLADDELVTWIADRRVTADTYLWRVGWSDWRLASDSPLELPTPLSLAAIIGDPIITLPITAAATELPIEIGNATPLPTAVPIVSEVLPLLPGASIRPRRRQTPIIITVLLIFTIVLLVGVLIWVIRRSSGSNAVGPQTQRIPIARARERS
jgi:GYF domain 2